MRRIKKELTIINIQEKALTEKRLSKKLKSKLSLDLEVKFLAAKNQLSVELKK